MLETPFGKVSILVDGVAIHYEAKPFDFIKPPVKDKPIAGCYRILMCFWTVLSKAAIMEQKFM